MDGHLGGWLRLLVLLYLCALPTAAYRKCKGDWAIHSCFGGNGKRSDPGLAMAVDADGQTGQERAGLEQGGLLQRLLSRQPYPELNDFPEPQDPRLSSVPAPYSFPSLGERDSFSPEARRFPTRDGHRLRSMLRTLMLERQLQGNNAEEELA